MNGELKFQLRLTLRDEYAPVARKRVRRQLRRMDNPHGSFAERSGAAVSSTYARITISGFSISSIGLSCPVPDPPQSLEDLATKGCDRRHKRGDLPALRLHPALDAI